MLKKTTKTHSTQWLYLHVYVVMCDKCAYSCVHLCMHMQMRVCTHVCAVHVETKGWHQCLTVLSVERQNHIEPGSHGFGHVNGPLKSRDSPVFVSVELSYKLRHWAQLSTLVLGIWTQVLKLAQQVLHRLSRVPSCWPHCWSNDYNLHHAHSISSLCMIWRNLNDKVAEPGLH